MSSNFIASNGDGHALAPSLMSPLTPADDNNHRDGEMSRIKYTDHEVNINALNNTAFQRNGIKCRIFTNLWKLSPIVKDQQSIKYNR